MSATVHSMLNDDQLNDADRAVLRTLAEDGGRLRPVNIADATGRSRSYVSQRLKRLLEHGHVDRPHAGLYELVDDPREASDE